LTYEEALSYIHNTLKFGIKPGLERIEELMARLGDPQEKLRIVHIAGTNGKGSTATMISSVLIKAGYKTGLFTSPYIVDFCERIQINGTYISHELLSEVTERVKAVVEKMTADGFEHPTEFELITAIAFVCFCEAGCDIVVLETGLGGRLDSTNIVKNTDVCVITSISLDHMNVLGDTIELIAKEKAGIIKRGADVVEYPLHEDNIKKIFDDTSKDVGANLCIPDMSKLNIVSEDIGGADFIYDGLVVRVNLTGHHQIFNAVNAICALKRLIARGVKISDNDIIEGVAAARIPGRFEVIKGTSTYILDGGHNAEGVDVLCDSLVNLKIERPVVIMGMLRDKAYEECITKVAKLSGHFIAVDIDNPRALTRCEVRDIASKYTDAVDADISEAVDIAKGLCGNDSVILVCGSLYLVSDIREKIIEK